MQVAGLKQEVSYLMSLYECIAEYGLGGIVRGQNIALSYKGWEVIWR